ncbi:hypothetical protein [Rhizomicrobium electricum]|jgi:hypothetical protein|uniref:Transcriptional regulator n=1 Tax=Rhizomicrobium electricum TaxID=480070 RepID=A0ABN1ESC4_9PROT|nr:hypothetical protein [Rhizomicrobium electricum]NIJ49082.1 hypothetical protein [Rhizomicrobium electricum]
MSDNGTNPPHKKRATARLNAQDKFAASERRDMEVRKEIQQQQAAAAAKTVKLRALRLAKEEADRLAAASATPLNPKKKKSSSQNT